MKVYKILLSTVMIGLLSCSNNSGIQTETESIPEREIVTIEDRINIKDEPSITGNFSITTIDGHYIQDEAVYTIDKGGTYIFTGCLEEGNVVIDAPETDEVDIELRGCYIASSSNSPIFAKSADKVKLKSIGETYNVIKDKREKKTFDYATQGEGAIAAKCDLSITGKGNLFVYGSYNNGIHTTKDLKIKNTVLQVVAPNNVIKAKDSFTMESGDVILVAKEGNGIKTENSDVSSKGNQKGFVNILGGALKIDAPKDGIDAAYDVAINGGVTLIKTGSYSSSQNEDIQDSCKGIVANNAISIEAGEITIESEDDCLHANSGDLLQNSEFGLGNISISGGDIYLATKDDAIHADNRLDVSKGNISIIESHEGLEATYVFISGGNAAIKASDDGINASKTTSDNPEIKVSGGFIDITVSEGDTDGVDTNGTYLQTGGTLITRCPNDGYRNALPLSSVYDAKISGGTLITIGSSIETVTCMGDVIYHGKELKMDSGYYVLLIENHQIVFWLDESYDGYGVYCATGSDNNKLLKNGIAIDSW